MTTHEIRRNIYVYSWASSRHGLHNWSFCVKYRFHRNEKTVILSKDELISELIAISSIDEAAEFENYTISQWDVICITVRHELKEATNKEIEHLFKL